MVLFDCGMHVVGWNFTKNYPPLESLDSLSLEAWGSSAPPTEARTASFSSGSDDERPGFEAETWSIFFQKLGGRMGQDEEGQIAGARQENTEAEFHHLLFIPFWSFIVWGAQLHRWCFEGSWVYPKRRVVLLNNSALNLMLQCFNIFFSNLKGTIVERRTLTKVEAAQTQLLASSDWHLHWCFARWLSGSLQARPLSELAKIYRPLEWSDIGTSARLAISMVKISEFQVVCEETFWISQWGTAFMDLTFDLNSAFASLRTRGSWVCFPNIAKSQMDIFSPVARSQLTRTSLGNPTQKIWSEASFWALEVGALKYTGILKYHLCIYMYLVFWWWIYRGETTAGRVPQSVTVVLKDLHCWCFG